MCQKERQLVEGHITPRFVIKWLRETSATGYLRSPATPNKREQDGPKKYIFCAICDNEVLGAVEDDFSRYIFTPYVTSSLGADGNLRPDGQVEFHYDNWLLKFALSLQLRHIIVFEKEKLSHRFGPILTELSEYWRHFIMGNRATPGHCETHLFFLQSLSQAEATDWDTADKNVNQYFLRATDGTLVWSNSLLASFAKIGPIAFWTTIYPSRVSRMRGTSIGMRGTINTRQAIGDPGIGTFLLRWRPEDVFRDYKISDRQQTKINESVSKNKERYLNSMTYQATAADIDLEKKKAGD